MVAQHLMDAAVMWKKLKEMYEQVNPAARFNAYAEFFNIHKKDDESLTNLVSRVGQALHKIRSTRSPTLTVEQLELELSCACLCNALPKEYESFRSAVLLYMVYSQGGICTRSTEPAGACADHSSYACLWPFNSLIL